MRLYISSGTHIDGNLDVRIENIISHLGEPDIVFAEGDSSAFEKDQLRALAKASLISPVLGLAIFVQIYVIIEGVGKILSRFPGDTTGKDTGIISKMKQNHGIESTEVDIGPSKHLLEHWKSWAAISWAGVFLITLFSWPIQITLPAVLWYLFSLLSLGYLLLMVLISLTLRERDSHMVSEIIEMNDDVDTACLITGEVHHVGVGKRLKNSSEVEVINPHPDKPGLTTKIFLTFHRMRQSLLPD